MFTNTEAKAGIAAATIGLIVIFLFVAVALLTLLIAGWEPSSEGFSLDAYIFRILRFTLLQAALSTILSVILAIPVARALSRQPAFFGRVWLIRLMAVPMGLPVLIGALGLVQIWGRQGLLNQLLSYSGLSQPISIYGLAGILLGHVFFNLPLATRLLLAGLERVPSEYWRMSDSLGMSSAATFRFVEWPAIRLLLPGISGLIFILCATSFTLVLMLGGGPGATTLEVAIYQSLRFDFDPAHAIALSLLQVAITSLVLAGLTFFPPPPEEGMTHGGMGRRFAGEKPFARLTDGLVLIGVAGFLLCPLLAIVVNGINANLAQLVLQPLFIKATLTSAWISALSALISLGISFAFVHARAIIASRREKTGASLAIQRSSSAATTLILLVPPIVLATGWFMLLRLWTDPARLAAALIIAVNALMALPFVIRVLEPAYQTHRHRTARLASSLGLSFPARFRIVDWPGLRKPLLTAFSFAMALSLGDLGAIALFGSDSVLTLPWLVYSKLGSYRTNDANGYALLLGIFCFLLTTLGALGQSRQTQERAVDER